VKVVLAGVMMLGAAGPAMAALQCQYYDQMVAEAPMVMQIAVESVVPPEGGGQGRCIVSGEIVRSFKGPHPVGTGVQTAIPCEAPLPEGAAADIEIGATIWWDFDALAAAAVIELHAAPEGGPAGYGAGVRLLDAPTAAPVWTPHCN
jgi:hypothetical protein